MSKSIGFAARLTELEREIQQEFEEQVEAKRREFRYQIEKGKIAFERDARAIHKKLRQGVISYLWNTPFLSLLVSPLIYSLLVPLVILDIWIWIYQVVCFRVYRIAMVDRSRYIVLDRGHLQYLNWIERFNCNYCGYANGLIAYVREVAARTEQYFCPIKHARRIQGTHSRYHNFLDFGEAKVYRTRLAKLRAELLP